MTKETRKEIKKMVGWGNDNVEAISDYFPEEYGNESEYVDFQIAVQNLINEIKVD